MSKKPDRRFTVSVAADVADRVDDFVQTRTGLSRSEVVEQALGLWEALAHYPNKDQVLQDAINLYEKQQERELYREYYESLSREARSEDTDWASLVHVSAAQNWPPPEPVSQESKNHECR